jgi:23S rRNA (cytosine1962-C5)-methyltransferase
MTSRDLSSEPRAFAGLLARAVDRRRGLIDGGQTQAFRVFSGSADGMDGVFVDVYAGGAVLIVYEGRPPRAFNPTAAAATVLDLLKPNGLSAVYVKPFAKDRSRLGGALPAVATDPTPTAGLPLPEATLIREHDWTLEVRLYDGLSTGLFLDQRENRRFIADHCRRHRNKASKPAAVLNTFAYTCAFSVAGAVGGAITTSVDVSARYLDWGKRNFTHNGLDVGGHRFARMDTFEFFAYAARKNLRYDVIVLDPPSFASGSKKKGIRAWSSVVDYARLVAEAAHLLNRGGMMLASTNTAALCRGGQFDREIDKGLGRSPKWIELPDPPIDFTREQDRFVARAWSM